MPTDFSTSQISSAYKREFSKEQKKKQIVEKIEKEKKEGEEGMIAADRQEQAGGDQEESKLNDSTLLE